MALSAEEKCLEALKKILSSYPEYSNFSLGEYAECAVCMEKKGNNWEVYHAERLNHYESQEFADIITACMAVIDAVGFPDDMQLIKQQFIQEITNTDQYLAAI